MEALDKILNSAVSDKSKSLVQQELETRGANNENTNQPNIVNKGIQPKLETQPPIPENPNPITRPRLAENSSQNTGKVQTDEYSKAIEDTDLEDKNTFRHAARIGLMNKVSPEVIEQDLVEQGMDQDTARAVVKAQAIKLRGERGEMGENEFNERMKRYISQRQQEESRVKDEEEASRPAGGGTVGGLKSTFETTHEYLKNSGDPNAKAIGEQIPYNYDQEVKERGKYKNEVGKDVSSIPKKDRETLVDYMRGLVSNPSPEIKAAANSIFETMNHMWKGYEERQEQTGIGLKKSGERMGKLDNYITQMKKESTPEIWEGIKDSIFGKNEKPIYRDTDIHNETTGKPQSPYAETRVSEPQELERDPNILFGKYIDSMMRLKWRKPTSVLLQKNLNNIPEGTLRDTAENYLKSYAIKNPYASDFWDPKTKIAMKIDANSRMLLNLKLLGLHIARTGFIAHDIPLRDIIKGTMDIATPAKFSAAIKQNMLDGLSFSPAQSHARLFESVGQKITNAMAAYRLADVIPETFGRAWNNARYIREGFSPEEADAKAITQTKNEALHTDPVRESELFSRYLQGPLKLEGQYRKTRYKLYEKYLRDVSKTLPNKLGGDKELTSTAKLGMLSRIIANTGIAYGITHGLGITVQELGTEGWNILKNLSSPVVDEATRIAKMVQEGNYEDAAGELAVYLTPGGMSVRGQIKKGTPSLFESNPVNGDNSTDYPEVTAP